MPRVRVAFDGSQCRGWTLSVVQKLRDGDPGIAVVPGVFEDFCLGPEFLSGNQPNIVMTRVIEELRACGPVARAALQPAD